MERIITEEKKQELRALLAKVSISKICQDLNIPRHSVDYALKAVRPTQKSLEALASVTQEARKRVAEREKLLSQL